MPGPPRPRTKAPDAPRGLDHLDARGQGRTVRYELPWPPSINNYWKRGRTTHAGAPGNEYLSEQARNFRAEVAMLVMKARGRAGPQPLKGPLLMVIAAEPPDRKGRDLDNIIKATQDGLQTARAFDDDVQIQSLQITRCPTARPGRVTVTLTELTNTNTEQQPC